MKPDQTFWISQKAFISKDDDILILIDPIEGLDFPGGKIQEGEENLSESLKREVSEETGLEIKVDSPFMVWQNAYPEDHKHAGQKVYSIAFKCEYVSGDVKLSGEHDKYKWVNKNNYKETNDGTEYFNLLEKYFKL